MEVVSSLWAHSHVLTSKKQNTIKGCENFQFWAFQVFLIGFLSLHTTISHTTKITPPAFGVLMPMGMVCMYGIGRFDVETPTQCCLLHDVLSLLRVVHFNVHFSTVYHLLFVPHSNPGRVASHYQWYTLCQLSLRTTAVPHVCYEQEVENSTESSSHSLRLLSIIHSGPIQ